MDPQTVASSTELPRDLALDVHTSGVRVVVAVSGDLDLHTAPALRRELEVQARRGHDQMVVDLDGVTFLDSIALGVLVGAQQRLASVDGTFEIVCSNERVLRLLRITGLDASMRVRASIA